MKESYRVPLLTNFWYETDREKDPVLYQDQLGWQEFHKVESGGYTDKKDIWKHLVGFSGKDVVGWDLGFFYVPTRTFYYLDQMAKVIYKLPISPDESEPLFARVDIRPQIVPEEDEVFDFNNISEVWDNFTIDGNHMPYILDHSVLVLST
ncbi:MAG: hypothetical protein HDR75_03755 [Bacteroides sp.]|nr:hypothetical protein [Bacteroides sp.]MBD5372446.1 hypothetical protein [Bacteroides sp.]